MIRVDIHEIFVSVNYTFMWGGVPDHSVKYIFFPWIMVTEV